MKLNKQEQYISELASNLTELKLSIADDLRHESIEWYLNNHIDDYLNTLESIGSKQDIQSTVYTFSRFCTDTMDWDSSLYKECVVIMKLGTKLSKSVELKGA